MEYTITVIVPTYNGAKKIANILKALGQQTLKNFETIVVVDGSTDNTEEIIQQQDFSLSNLKVVVQENGGRSVARNRGAREAKGDLLIFFDDDMRPVPMCVALHLQHHQKNPHTILVGNQLEDYTVLKNDIQHFKAYLSRKWAKPLEKERCISKETPFITAANFSITQSLFFNLQGFDERLTDAEDFDLAVKATERETDIYFSAEAMGWHDDFITCKTYIRRQRQYKKSHEVLKSIKPEIYKDFTQYEFHQIGFLKKIIYNFFARKFWVWSIDTFNWMKVLPKKLRYKLYDIIITGYAVYFPHRKI